MNLSVLICMCTVRKSRCLQRDVLIVFLRRSQGGESAAEAKAEAVSQATNLQKKALIKLTA